MYCFVFCTSKHLFDELFKQSSIYSNVYKNLLEINVRSDSESETEELTRCSSSIWLPAEMPVDHLLMNKMIAT